MTSVAAITGSAEPVYGIESIHSVTDSVTPETAYQELEANDYKWIKPDWGSNVETQTFYVFAKTGEVCFAQIIHSNPSGFQYTAQFTCRIFDPSKPDESVWSSTTLEDFSVAEDEGRSFTAKGASVTLSDDYRSYTLKINVNPETIVDLTITRDTPAFKIGETGDTIYGPLEKPWGTMRHLFWPRCTASGVILVKGIPRDVSGTGQVIHALQGMKPHHAASRWNFGVFQGKTMSVTLMEFVTPESYLSTKVNIGGITIGDRVLSATTQNSVVHKTTKLDEETSWEEPTEMTFKWSGVEAHEHDGKKRPVHAEISKVLSKRMERVDVLSEIPPWLKKIAYGVAGTKPFIYQFVEPASLKVTIGEGEAAEVLEEEGVIYIEATFIS